MYDVIVHRYAEWDELVRADLGLVVDPLIYRMGQFFLEGEHAAGAESEGHWNAISQDLTSLVTFLDMIVLYDRLPAFNYSDTFPDPGPLESLQTALNRYGEKVLYHVDVEHDVYREVKASALVQLEQLLANGPFISSAAAQSTLATLTTIQYAWEPNLEQVGTKITVPDERRLAQFLLGQLVFSGYSQLTGSPQIVAPRQSAFLVAAGLQETDAGTLSESALYDELRRRIRDAGDSWRDVEAPWTPSFVPYLLSKMNVYRQGPDELVQMALDLRENKDVQRYRTLRRDFLSTDPLQSAEAQKLLTRAAEKVARNLATGRADLEVTKSIFVERLPKAAGIVAGAGALAGGTSGAILGGLAGLAAESALKPLQNPLWGWLVDGLPCRRAAKLLTRTVMAEHKMRNDLGKQLHAVWETGPRKS
ncbi:MAG: hypothetical protein ABI563_04140 [Specibacter sp.]